MAAERYRRIELIGSGGMATVWRGEDTELGRPVAIKLISEVLAHDEAFMRRFEREARIASALSHPGLVPVFDYEPDAEQPFIVMELVEGGTLAGALDAGTPIDAGELARQLLAALDHIHAAGIVHRDVKPGNLLIDDGGNFRLTDFGIAMGEESTRYTRTGNVVGTLRYMAPEVKSGRPATPASDLYSAGMVIGDAAAAAGSEALGGLLTALTADDPAARPASAAAAIALLEGGDDATAVAGAAPAPTAPTEVLAGRRRGPLPFVAAGLAALAVVALAAALLGGGDDEPAPATEAVREQPRTETVTETGTAAEQPAAGPAGGTPPGRDQAAPADCDQLKEQEKALKEERKEAEKASGKDKEAKEAAKQDYEAREEQLKDEVEACKEAEKAAG